MNFDMVKLQKAIALLAQQFQPEKVILFGSWAYGEPNPNSDVDLCVIKNTQNTRSLAREIDSSLFPRPFPIDLLVMTPKQMNDRLAINDYFVTEIIQKGKLLYAKR